MIKVTLRKKKISQGMESLFLDFYPPIWDNGKETRRDFLKLYIHQAPATNLERKHNKRVLEDAELIRQKRQYDINRPTVLGVEPARIEVKREIGIVDYARKVSTTKGENRGRTIRNACLGIEEAIGNVKLTDIDRDKTQQFRDFLENSRYEQNTKKTYFTVFKSLLNNAFRERLILNQDYKVVPGFSQEETERKYLSLEELKRLSKSYCDDQTIYRASLFSALTGLRYSDIEKLTWGEVRDVNGGTVVTFRQKKTKTIETIHLSDQARGFLGQRSEDDKMVFEGLKYGNRLSRILMHWGIEAGLTKPLTFHVFRHTFATLQLSAGTDIYTVSKLLGHRDLKTTAIYAKIVDEEKRKAVNRIIL